MSEILGVEATGLKVIVSDIQIIEMYRQPVEDQQAQMLDVYRKCRITSQSPTLEVNTDTYEHEIWIPIRSLVDCADHIIAPDAAAVVHTRRSGPCY